MGRRRSDIEKAMIARRKEAVAAVEKLHPDPQEVTVSFFDLDVIVDVLDAEGETHRYSHSPNPTEDSLSAAREEAFLGRKKVVYR